jgi:hypothetical protein
VGSSAGGACLAGSMRPRSFSDGARPRPWRDVQGASGPGFDSPAAPRRRQAWSWWKSPTVSSQRVLVGFCRSLRSAKAGLCHLRGGPGGGYVEGYVEHPGDLSMTGARGHETDPTPVPASIGHTPTELDRLRGGARGHRDGPSLGGRPPRGGPLATRPAAVPAR